MGCSFSDPDPVLFKNITRKNYIMSFKGLDKLGSWCGEYAITENFITCTVDLDKFYKLNSMRNEYKDYSKVVIVLKRENGNFGTYCVNSFTDKNDHNKNLIGLCILPYMLLVRLDSIINGYDS